MDFEKMVSDWGGFEELVAKLHETGDVVVERDVTLPGRSGAPRQIDVLIRHRQGFYEHLVIIECKYWQHHVERLHVDALATTIREVGADQGVIFSRKGFQSGAVTQAEADGIDLFVVRDVARHEWGGPGRIVDLFLQIAQVCLGGIEANGQFIPTHFGLMPDARDLQIDLRFADGKAESSTVLLRQDGLPSDATLEDRILQALAEVSKSTHAKVPLFNSGANGDFFLGTPITLNAHSSAPFRIRRKSGIMQIPSIKINAAVKITQSRITVDRSHNLEFALAVESKISGEVSLASRAIGSVITNLHRVQALPDNNDDAVRNGQIIHVLIAGIADMSEANGKDFLPLETLVQPFHYSDPNDE